MSSEHVLPEQLLEAASVHQAAPRSLASAASTFLGALFRDPQWHAAQRALGQLSRDDRIEGMRRRYELALGLIHFSASDEQAARRVARDRVAERRALAAELKAAEEEYRARIAEISERFPQVAEAADQISKDATLGLAARGIVRNVWDSGLSRLGPYWMLIVLWWLIAHIPLSDVTALALWYAVARDVLKKPET